MLTKPSSRHFTLPKLILASTSERRKWLLQSLNLKFSGVAPPGDEITPTYKNVKKGVIENAKIKALSAFNLVKEDNFLLISADTLVALRGEVLGKPKSRDEARSMLQLLSGKTHQVFTGVVILNSQKKMSAEAIKSEVTFKKLSKLDIKNYLSTNEPYDKAGSYAVQGLSCLFIKNIKGSYTNVMGLPIDTVLKLIQKTSSIPIHHFFL